MNKQIISWGMMLAAAFTLTNCTKEIDNPNHGPETSGIPFELVATSVDTKTDNTAGVVAWSADDAINIFHAEATTDAYINDGSFTIQEADLNDGRFTGNLKEGETLSAEKYDWYAFYPYTSQIATPANTSKGWTPVGSKHNEKQAQDGYDNMDHISGANYPLYGVAKNVASNDRPSITMNHAYSIAKIVVKNTTEQELTVETVSFTAPVNIVGTYYINFADESLTFTNSGDSYVSKTAELEVSNGTALQKDAEAAFYIAFVPFTAAANETLTLSVNGYSKEIKLTKDVTFAAGKIKTLNFEYDEEVTETEDYSGRYAAVVLKSTEYVYLTTDASGSRLATADSGVTEITDYTTTLVDFAAIKPEYVWTIEKIANSSYYTMCANSKYIKKVGTTSNYAYSDSNVANAEPLSLVYNEEGKYYTITSTTSGYSGRTLSVNTQNTYYAFYGNTTQLYKIVLIPYEEDTTPVLDAPTNIQTSVNYSNSTIEISWDSVENATSYVVTCNGSSYDVTTSNCEISWAEYGVYNIVVKANAEGYRSSSSDVVELYISDPTVSTTTVTFVCADGDFVASGTTALVATDGTISVTQEKGTGSNFNVKYTNPLRFYGGNTLTVEGANITKVEIEYASGYSDANVTVNSGTYSNGLWGSSDEVNSVVFKNGKDSSIGQTRVSSITVTYAN